jgi:FkbM family methyltransferase
MKIRLRIKQFKIFIKESSQLIIIKIVSNFKFLDSAIKHSKGIGYQGNTKFEIDFLIGKESSRFILFDIGANIGNFTLAAAGRFPNCTIYSFEPSKASFDKLVENTRFHSNIVCVQTAFGEDTKQSNLYSDEAASGMASLFNRDLTAFGIEFKQIEVVKVQRLDDWVSNNKIIPDYIKIDVEGSELSVLKGGINTLRNIKAVQFEFGGTAIDARTYFKDYWNFFTSLNFIIYRYTPIGLHKIENYSESEEIFEFMNYVAVPHRQLNLTQEIK